MRARNIKPALFENELLGRADPLLTLLFQGLWCVADREGRLEDRPERLRVQIFPYRESLEIEPLLKWLKQKDFIDRYKKNGLGIIAIKNFLKHQRPHIREAPSQLPPRSAPSTNQGNGQNSPKTDSAPTEIGTSTNLDALIPDSGYLIPDLLIPDSGSSDSGSPLRGAALPQEAEVGGNPESVLKNGLESETGSGAEIRAGPKAVSEIVGSLRQRFQPS